MASIQSRKIGRRNGGKPATHVNGALATPYGAVLSSRRALILNITDGERMFNVILTPEESERVADILECEAA